MNAQHNKRLIPPEKVKKDNSNLYRCDPALAAALRKERFHKAKPEDFVDYCETAGLLDPEDIYAPVEFRMDLEKFISRLPQSDADLFRYRYLLGMSQHEIADMIGMSQSWVSPRLKTLRDRFKAFYVQE